MLACWLSRSPHFHHPSPSSIPTLRGERIASNSPLPTLLLLLFLLPPLLRLQPPPVPLSPPDACPTIISPQPPPSVALSYFVTRDTVRCLSRSSGSTRSGQTGSPTVNLSSPSLAPCLALLTLLVQICKPLYGNIPPTRRPEILSPFIPPSQPLPTLPSHLYCLDSSVHMCILQHSEERKKV